MTHFILRDQRATHEMWRTLVQPLGWTEHRLYACLVLADGSVLPQLLEIGEMPASFSRREADSFATFFRRVLDDVDPEGRVALLLCRPGPGLPTGLDLANAACLCAAARQHRVPLEVVHLATDREITPLPMDAAPLSA